MQKTAIAFLVGTVCFVLTGALALGQLVQSHDSTGASGSPSATFPSNPVSGNFLIAIVGCANTTIGSPPTGWSTAITQNGSSSYPGQAIFYKNSSGSSDRTVTFTNILGSSSYQWGMQIFEYANIAASSPFDVSASNTGNSSSPTTGTTSTTAQAIELIIVGVAINSSSASFSNWTNSFTEVNDFAGGTFRRFGSAQLIVGSIGTYSTGATAAASAGWRAQIATFKGTGALPIQMLSSAANVIRDNDVEVTWKTVSEMNNYGFEIYRKRGDIGEWTKLGFVEGHGTTLTPQSYSYIDRALSFGKYFYRIKQIDLDGESEIFPKGTPSEPEMEVTVGVAPGEFVLAQNYPNPFNPATTIEFAVPQNGRATIEVYNVLGQEVATVFDGDAEAGKILIARFDPSNLPSGLYFYTLRTAGKAETKRMLLLK
jgi:hypothetical protein